MLTASLITLNTMPLGLTQNRDNALEALRRATLKSPSSNAPDIAIFPELALTGYGCEDWFYRKDFVHKAFESLKTFSKDSSLISPNTVSVIGIPWLHENKLYNGAAVVCGGKIHGIVLKQFLAVTGVHYENRWFSPWRANHSVFIDSHQLWIGDIQFEIEGHLFGIEICEDAWVGANRPLSRFPNVEFVLNPSASHFAFRKLHLRKRIIEEAAAHYDVYYLYTNLIGNEAGRILYDGGPMVCAPNGKALVGKRFHSNSFSVDYFQFSPKKNKSPQIASAQKVLKITRTKKDILTNNDSQSHHSMENSTFVNQDENILNEFTQAATLGLVDALKKTRSNGFVVSLSGGVDSSVVSILAKLAVDRANLKIQDPTQKKKVYCVYQKTMNSSLHTENCAKNLAQQLHAEYFSVSLEAIHGEYLKTCATVLGRELTWEADDIALQNLQARLRVPTPWLIANSTQSLLLSTSNRSEVSVGYATMDGDTSGSFSPIAGVSKIFLQEWLNWILVNPPDRSYRLDAITQILSKPPTAELRPTEFSQTDEADLMPYEVLQKIECGLIFERKDYDSLKSLLREDFPHLKSSELDIYLDRYLRLFQRNQWKRERYAPAFHLDSYSLDPKSWLRFPIFSNLIEDFKQ